MRYAIVTDIHLNFLDREGFSDFAAAILDTGADGLFITGDIAEGPTVGRYLEELAQVLHKKPIYYVLGNHDFYQSSCDDVRTKLFALGEKQKNLHYMRTQSIQLTDTTVLVGVDGWADARLGSPEKAIVELADWTWIKDYKDVQGNLSVHARMQLAAKYGTNEANLLDQQLFTVLQKHVQKPLRIIVLTHIPPFKEATWHRGKHSDNDWVPWFSCKAVGDVLSKWADEYPHVAFDVRCGHCHGSGEYKHFDNLIVTTHGAEYGSPVVADVIEVF